jgi:hypothetical protein
MLSPVQSSSPVVPAAIVCVPLYLALFASPLSHETNVPIQSEHIQCTVFTTQL